MIAARRHLRAGVVSLAVLAAATTVPRAQTRSYEEIIEAAYRAAYNLEHDKALALAREAVAIAPGESAAHRGLAGILWLQIVFARGAVSIDHYISGITSGRLKLPPAPPALDAEFKAELDRAITLAEARLKVNPNEVRAQYDWGRAYALQASYTASVEGSAMRAFRAASRAYDTQEAILERQPDHPGATFVVGTYRYIVSALSLPTRWLAYMVGFGGGKERGIKMIESSARDPATRVDALTALMLIYTREGKHTDVMRLSRELHKDYPGNRLYVLEEGSAAIRAGRHADAEAILSRGIADLDTDPRPKVTGERAFWLYKRGVARLAQRRIAEAADDFVAALEAAPAGWIRGRIHIELGKVHDLASRRPQAIADYRMAKSLCDTNDDPACVKAAERGLDRPFGK